MSNDTKLYLAALLLGSNGMLLCQKAHAAIAPPSEQPKQANQRTDLATYTIKKGDTLLKIGQKLAPAGYSAAQMGVALFHANPNAFKQGNPHQLSINTFLKIPNIAEVKAISHADAIRFLHQALRKNTNANQAKPVAPIIIDTSPVRAANPIMTIAAPSSTNQTQTIAPLIIDTLSLAPRGQPTVGAIVGAPPTIAPTATPPVLSDEGGQSNIQPELTQRMNAYATTLSPAHYTLPAALANALHATIQQQYATPLSLIQQTIRTLQQQQSTLQQHGHSVTEQLNTLQAAQQRHDFLQPMAYCPLEHWQPQQYFRAIYWAQRQRAQPASSPLLQQINNLYCAEDEQHATKTLQRLFNISPDGQDWPDEGLAQKRPYADLYAPTLDIALVTLSRTIERFPSLQELSERVVLQWDYCSMYEEGQFFNLTWHEGQLTRIVSADSPLHWAGFRHWGFFSPDPPDRYVPRLLDEIRLAPIHYHWFLHRAYRERCFPHPVTGELAREADHEHATTQRNIYPTERSQALLAYPYTWQPVCDIPAVTWFARPFGQRLQITLAQQLIQAKAQQANLETQLTVSQLALQQLTEQIATQQDQALHALSENEFAKYKAEQLAAMEQSIKAELSAQAQASPDQVAQPSYSTKRTEQLTLNRAAIGEQLAAIHQAYEQDLRNKATQIPKALPSKPALQNVAKVLPAPTPALQNTANVLPLKQVKPVAAAERLTTISHHLTKQHPNPSKRTTTAAIQQAQRPDDTKNLFMLYDSSHERFWDEDALSTKISPVKSKGNKTDPKTSASAKPKAPQGYMFKLSTTVAHLTSLATGQHSLNSSFSWTPLENWFVNGQMSYQYSGDNPKGLTYGWNAGYNDWRPGTFSAQINNYVLNPGDGLGLDKATLNLGYKFDSDWLRKHKLGGGINYTRPLLGSGAGKASLNMQYNITDKIYLRTTATQSLDGGYPNWTYGFGYSDWRPNKLRIEYSNYGNNTLPFTNLNQGSISINETLQYQKELTFLPPLQNSKQLNFTQQIAKPKPVADKKPRPASKPLGMPAAKKPAS